LIAIFSFLILPNDHCFHAVISTFTPRRGHRPDFIAAACSSATLEKGAAVTTRGDADFILGRRGVSEGSDSVKFVSYLTMEILISASRRY
jgi:hypothetical protein